jgi:ketosteroid isomerase-like protein
MHPNAELIKAFYEARARGDRAAVLSMLDEAVAWHDPYPPPHGGDLLGAERAPHPRGWANRRVVCTILSLVMSGIMTVPN